MVTCYLRTGNLDPYQSKHPPVLTVTLERELYELPYPRKSDWVAWRINRHLYACGVWFFSRASHPHPRACSYLYADR